MTGEKEGEEGASGSGSRQLQSGGGVGCTPSCSLRRTTDADEVTPPPPSRRTQMSDPTLNAER